MKSRELLQIIKKDYNWETADCECDAYFKNYFTQIEKDLEVLETLKKYIVITSNLSDESQWLTFDRYIYNDDIDTEADFYLIKEWLENDKISKNNN